MKTKNGFTLAEVLVTMGVIGVISAMVVPQVVTNVEKNKAGLTLARAVEQIELGCQGYIMEDVDGQTLVSIKAGSSATTSSARANKMKKFIDLKSEEVKKSLYVKAEDTISLSSSDTDEADKRVIAFSIDINGTAKGQNQYGRDKFLFYLNNSCKMIPHGLDNNLEYKTKCANGNFTDGKTCAARVVRDGYKITY